MLRLFCCLFFLLASPVSGAEEVLRLGIVPFNSSVTLLKTHLPLQQHLEQQLKRRVRSYTSADQAAFLADSLKDRFDIILTPPHFAAICLERGYTPLVRYRSSMSTIFVVRADSKINSIADLRGKRIAFPERIALFSLVGTRVLEENGMHAGADYEAQERHGYAAAMVDVAMKKADAAVTTPAPMNQMPADIRNQLRFIVGEKKQSAPRPHVMAMARAQLGTPLIAQIHSALNSFPNTDAGKAFFRSTGYEGYVPITEQDFKLVQPYTDMIRPLLPPQHSPGKRSTN